VTLRATYEPLDAFYPEEPGSRLSDHIAIRPQFGRSVNLERDAGGADVTTYVPGARAIDTLRRLVVAMHYRDSVRAWSITGPYGSGKSSFALFLHSLLGPLGTGRRVAETVLQQAAPDLLSELVSGRRKLGADAEGFIRAVAVAEREPASQSLLRSLELGIRTFWHGATVPERVAELQAAANEARAAGNVGLSRAVVQLAAELARHAPVVIVLDEFGKNLEAFADAGPAADYFVLQQLAELASGERGQPLFLLTLQHQAFEEYAARAVTPQLRREWGKVQGRFEDVPFVESGEHATQLIASVFDTEDAHPTIRRQIAAWAEGMFAAGQALGLGGFFGDSVELLARCYPLHPLTVVALPELCARYAQHERTLMSFLAGGEANSVATRIEGLPTSGDSLPVIGLDAVYEYFVQSAATAILGSAEASRWLEVQRRVEESTDLEPELLPWIRSLAVLNLSSAGGLVRASQPMLAFAMAHTAAVPNAEPAVAVLRQFEQRGLVTYRKHADEYRIWQGSDFDLAEALDLAKQRMQDTPLSLLLQRLSPLPPAVVGRHSQKTGLLRYFAADWVDAFTGVPRVPLGADGLLLYVVGQEPDWNEYTVDGDLWPRVVIRTSEAESLREVVLEAAAIKDVLDQPDLIGNDWVARRELQERFTLAELRMRDTLSNAFAPGRPGVTWHLLGSTQQLSATGTVSRILSDVCDTVYHRSPHIQNEMLARRELTSQGSKARRDLLEAMVMRQSHERLGLEGYGPERAMYESVLRHTGIHYEDNGAWRFGPPRLGSGLEGMWVVLEDLLAVAGTRKVSLADVRDALMNPPVGLKEGPIPVFISALLLDRADDVAVYEDGTYQALLTVDLIERLVKRPETFAIKAVKVDGPRGIVIHALAEALGVPVLQRGKRRNLPVLSVVSPLLGRVRGLPEYTLRTKHLSERVAMVRAALLAAAEPDVLIFDDLPRACGCAPFAPGTVADDQQVSDFVALLFEALKELDAAYPALLARVEEQLAITFRVPSGAGLRTDLSTRARHLTSRVLDKSLRSLILALDDEGLDEEDWLPAVAMNIVGKPTPTWRDEDVELFDSTLSRVAGAFLRVEALYFETGAHQREGFEAKRVTVTAPDGTEYNQVVWVDGAVAPTLEQIAASVLDDVRTRLGDESGPALLAALASQLHREYLEREAELPEQEPEHSRLSRMGNG